MSFPATRDVIEAHVEAARLWREEGNPFSAGIAGAVLLLVAATQSGPGMIPTLIALPGFLIWLIFVIGYSVLLLRGVGSE